MMFGRLLFTVVFFLSFAIFDSAIAVPPPPPGGTVPIRPFFKSGTPLSSPMIHGSASQNLGQGIYNHQVYSATSSDGLRWIKDSQLIFDHASVPESVITSAGKIFLYFMDASTGHSMSVGISTDLGKTWTKQTVEISARQTSGHAVDPNIVILDDGTFRMFYLGTFGPQSPGQKQESHICSALSSDGIHFKEEKGFRFSKNGMITDPDAIKTNSGWMMFVSEGRKNLSTSSENGMDFFEKIEPASTQGSVSKTIFMNNGYRMYRCGHGIESQFTTDFKSWIQEGQRLSPDFEKIMCDPSVIRLPDGTYKMFYKTAPMNRVHQF